MLTDARGTEIISPAMETSPVTAADTPRELIARLGGVHVVAALCGKNAKAVWQWHRRGIPAHAIDRVRQEAVRLHIPVAPALWETRRYERQPSHKSDKQKNGTASENV